VDAAERRVVCAHAAQHLEQLLPVTPPPAPPFPPSPPAEYVGEVCASGHDLRHAHQQMRPSEDAVARHKRTAAPEVPASYDPTLPYSGRRRVWGVENREAPLRLCASAGPGAQNWELRALDATANPHLPLAAVVAAGCDARALPASARLPPSGVAPSRRPRLTQSRL